MKTVVLIEYRPEIGVFLLLVFGLSSFIGLAGALTGNNLTGDLSFLQEIVSPFGDWVYWLSLFGLVGFIIDLAWVLDYWLKTRKLKELIDTESKAKFIKNMDDIEYIAWRLPKKYRALVAQKKVDLKITK